MNKSKIGFISDIEDETLQNNNFRHVLYTAENMQIVAMCLAIKEEIGMEIHPENDQFFKVVQGKLKVILKGEESLLVEDMVLIVPAGIEHNIINVGNTEAKLYTIYSPPVHRDGTTQKSKPRVH